MLLVGGYLACILAEALPRGVLLGERRYMTIAVIVVGGAVVRLVVSAVWSAVDPSVVAPLIGPALGEGVTAAGLLVGLRLLATPGRRSEHLHIVDIGLSIAGFTGLLSLMSIDTVAARHFLTGTQSGYYAVASGLGSIAYFMSAAAASAVFPDVALGVSNNQRRSFLIGLGEVSALALAAAGILLIGATPLIRILYGERYLGATNPLRVLAISYALLGILFYLLSHHLAHRSRMITLTWLGAALLTGSVMLVHGTPLEVALDALLSSGSLLVILGGVSIHLERRRYS